MTRLRPPDDAGRGNRPEGCSTTPYHNSYVVEQLESKDFACGDTIVFFTQVTVDTGATGTQSIRMTTTSMR